MGVVGFSVAVGLVVGVGTTVGKSAVGSSVGDTVGRAIFLCQVGLNGLGTGVGEDEVGSEVLVTDGGNERLGARDGTLVGDKVGPEGATVSVGIKVGAGDVGSCVGPVGRGGVGAGQ